MKLNSSNLRKLPPKSILLLYPGFWFKATPLFIVLWGGLDIASNLPPALLFPFSFLIYSILILILVKLYQTFFHYQFLENEFRKDEGVFHKTAIAVPYDKILDIHISQGFIAKKIGLAQVNILTMGNMEGGSFFNKTISSFLPGIPIEEALFLQKKFFDYNNSRNTTQEENLKQFPIEAFWIVFVETFFVSIFLFPILGGFIIPVVLSQVYYEIFNFLSASILCLFLLAIIDYFIAKKRFKNYKYELTKNGFKKHFGILSENRISIPYKGIQNIYINSNPLLEIFGLVYFDIQSASFGNKYFPEKPGRLILYKEDAKLLQIKLTKKIS